MRMPSAADLDQIAMEADRIIVSSPLSGFRIEVGSRLGQRITTTSRSTRKVEVQSPVVRMIRVSSALSLEELR
jgi:hypothetical protein